MSSERRSGGSGKADTVRDDFPLWLIDPDCVDLELERDPDDLDGVDGVSSEDAADASDAEGDLDSDAATAEGDAVASDGADSPEDTGGSEEPGDD